MTEYECPLCGANLQGEEIPEENREWYGNHTHFSRKIGIYDMDEDRTVRYRCPDCEGEWKR